MAQQHVLTSQPVNTCRPQARKRRQRRAEMERAAPARLMAQGAAIRTGSSARQCRSRLWRESPEARLELPATASVQTSRVKVCPSFRLEHACARPAYPRDPHALLAPDSMLRARQSSLGAPPRVRRSNSLFLARRCSSCRGCTGFGRSLSPALWSLPMFLGGSDACVRSCARWCAGFVAL